MNLQTSVILYASNTCISTVGIKRRVLASEALFEGLLQANRGCWYEKKEVFESPSKAISISLGRWWRTCELCLDFLGRGRKGGGALW